MKNIFEIAGGTVLGKEHARFGKNNQDAFAWRQTEDFTIAVVADGCGSGKFSEVGAQIGVRLFVSSLERSMKHYCSLGWSFRSSRFFWNTKLEYARWLMIKDFENLIGRMIHKSEMREYFLFTLVGAVITQENSALFHIGDGVICKNGVITELGPYPNNQPPYLAYDLLDQSITGFSSEELTFSVPFVAQTPNIQSILIGTDGVMDLIRSENEKIPGKEEVVGQLSQFWENDLYFKNPDAIRRRLSIINRPSMKIDWEKQEVEKEEGHLPDDTTLIVIRRR